MRADIQQTTDFSLIDMLLEDQQTLRTPVGKFSEKHDQHDVNGKGNRYQDLIPLSKPKVGEQYAFQVDLDKCTGCKACVTACHNLNGLDVKEAWRDAGKIIQPDLHAVSFQQTVTTACHHCDDPACLNGCPVQAYEKDPVTGIVRHLDDQCIGCQYCVLKCPYDVPKYNKKLGIVRKCDMCHHRLEGGEAPACVQACPNEAIKIVNVSKEAIQLQSESPFLPGAPEPNYTKPSTQYISKNKLPENLIAADRNKIAPQEAHLPLVFMLITTQLAVGFYSVAFFTNLLGHSPITLFPVTLITLLTAAVGIGFSTLHLGKPLKAWKAFLGVGKSWMSREVLAFAGILKVSAFLVLMYVQPWIQIPQALFNGMQVLLLVLGWAAVFASVKLYDDTKRRLWKFRITAFKFFSSTVILGIPGYLIFQRFLATQSVQGFQHVLLTAAILVLGLKLVNEYRFSQAYKHAGFSIEKKASIIIRNSLKGFFSLRQAAGFLATGVMLLAILMLHNRPDHVGISNLLLVAGLCLALVSEWCERYLFFTTVDAPKMPGEA